MQPIVASTQAQYDEAQKICQDSFDKSYFDINRGIGMNIIEEVDYFVFNYLHQNAKKEETEEILSNRHFTKKQAIEITGYFSVCQPKGLYDIERGLNILNLSADENISDRASLIQIKDSIEKINVFCPVEVFGDSAIEAFGRSRIIARNASQIIAHDQAIVEAFDQVQITAFDQTHTTARDNSIITLHNNSGSLAFDQAYVVAKDYSKAFLFDSTNAEVHGHAAINAYDESFVIAKNMANILAFNGATVHAYDRAHVTVKDKSYVIAEGQTSIIAEDNAVAIANGWARTTAKGRSLVFVRDEADCSCSEKALIISSIQNKPSFLKSNILRILDHPFINREPSVAVNLLIAAANPEDKTWFSRKLKAMGCVDSQSTDKVISSLVNEFDRRIHKKLERRDSWER